MTKGSEIIIFVRVNCPLMYTDNISAFFCQIHRLEFPGFAVEFFTVLLISQKSSSIIIGFIFDKPSAHDFLAHDFLAFRVI